MSCLRTAASAAAITGDTFDVPVLTAAPNSAAIDASWGQAAQVALPMDFTYKRPATESTDVYVAQDAAALDVAFVATQREGVTAAQEANGSSVMSDDYVVAYLWPQGTVGFAYSFSANPRGASYQTSSENSAYTPQWTATGHSTPTGYIVTMRIPLSVIRAGGSSHWRVQFARMNVATNSTSVWTFSPRQQNLNDPAFAGTLGNMGAAAGNALRPKARAQFYGLGEATTAANGGSTSRVGADLSLPVTPTASFVGTWHPDFSNVEIDQQTISPNAFQYQYQEVRPFFTQAGQAFNYMFSCSDCPQLLYTPNIPTFREGYALEGTQGPLTFSAFDALGDGRADQATALDYNIETKENSYGLNLQRIAVDASGGLHDDMTSLTMGVNNQHTHFFLYGNGAQETGTQVTDAQQARYFEGGGGYASSTTVAVLNYQLIGKQFDPVDSFVPQTDLNGYEFFAKHLFNFAPTAMLHDIQATTFYGWFHDSTGQPAQIDANENLYFDFKNLMTLRLYGSAFAARVADGEFLPFDSNSVELGYKIATNTPSYIQYFGGPFYHGTLDGWSYVTTVPVRRKLHLRLEADQNRYLTTHVGEVSGSQWLERATLDWQLNRNASFDIGLRKIIGQNLPNAYAAPDFTPINASNVTVAFHVLASRNEFYLVYGNPNSLATTPALYLKWIRYVGAGKGT